MSSRIECLDGNSNALEFANVVEIYSQTLCPVDNQFTPVKWR